MKLIKEFKRVFPLQIMLTAIAILFVIAGCNTNQNNADEKKETTLATAPLLQGKLYGLVMTKQEYDTLIYISAADTARNLNLHFYFKDAVSNYPTLVAYASKNKHYERYRDSVILTPTDTSFTLPSVKFMGTQQVRVRKIEKLLKLIFGTSQRNWDHLLFMPDIDNKKHIYYKITVWCTPTRACDIPSAGDGVVPTNPSPPKDAD